MQVDGQVEAENQAIGLVKDGAQPGAPGGGLLRETAVAQAVSVAGLAASARLAASAAMGRHSNRVLGRGPLPRLGRIEGGQIRGELGGVCGGAGRLQPGPGGGQAGGSAHDAAGGADRGAADRVIGIDCCRAGLGEERTLGLQQDGKLGQDAGVERRLLLPGSAARIQTKPFSSRVCGPRCQAGYRE